MALRRRAAAIPPNPEPITIDAVKKIISTSVDKSKLENHFNKNLEETKAALKKINS